MPRPYQERLDQFVHDLLLGAQMSVAIEEEIIPKLYLFKFAPDGTVKHQKALDVRGFIEGGGKSALANIMNLMMTDEDSPVDALVFLSEAWAASVPKAGFGLDNFKPSESPDKTEVLMVTVRYKHPASGTTMMYDIDRTNKTLTPSKDLTAGTVVGGRLSARGA